MAVISYHALRVPGEALRTVLASCTLELSNCSLICRHLSPMRQSGPATKLGSIFLHNQCVNGGERPCSVLARFGSSNGAGKLRHFGLGAPLGVCSQAGRRHHRRKEEIAGRSWNRNPFASKDKGDDKVEINIDLEEIKQKAGDAVAAAKNALQTSLHHAEQASRSFVQEGAQAWKDLGSSVAVQNDKQIVIAVRCSTIEFAGRALLWTIF